MFSLRKNTSSSTSPKDIDNTNPPPARFSRLLPSASLEPAIDGPPSPENIRAYTEQMKRNSFFANNNRSNVSSSASSFYSASSSNTSRDVSLSRTSSKRSNASSMPSTRERPDSIQIFGKAIFSRRTLRRSKRETGTGRTSSTLSEHPSRLTDSNTVYENPRSSTLSEYSSLEHSKSLISRPFNFQHVVHAGKEQVPDLSQSEGQLASDFSSIRASQNPAMGQLKGIRADDLHFENFSSERLNLTPELESDEFERPRTSPARRNTFKTSPVTAPLPILSHAKSHDGLRSTPPRPYRAPPLNLSCPVALPPRTSSRTPSMLWDNHDPLATTTLERPDTGFGFRKPKAFHLPISPPRSITRSFEQEEILYPSAPRTPSAEAWPLSGSGTFENFALADVPEEEEVNVGSRRSRLSTRSSLRYSRSVPDFVRMEQDPFSEESPMTPVFPEQPGEIGVALSPPKLDINVHHETWEDDIDYCYEHEVEANCEYEWDRCSLDVNRPVIDSAPDSAQNINRLSSTAGHSTPSHLDIPALSPSAVSLSSPAPYTPGPVQARQRISHLRSPSHASSFKESHGFHLSPSLLIPGDFASQMNVSLPPNSAMGIDLDEAEDILYDEIFSRHPRDDCHIQHNPFSRDSQDSQSSLPGFSTTSTSRSSGLSKSASLESVALLNRTVVALPHRSTSSGSSASLPELVHSVHSSPDGGRDPGMRPTKPVPVTATAAVALAMADMVGMAGREEVVVGGTARMLEELEVEIEKKSRARANSAGNANARKSGIAAAAIGGRRRAGSTSANYMLFPQVSATQTSGA